MKVLIYNEFVHEQHDGPAKDMYPRGMHMAIAEEIRKIDDSLEFSFATLEDHKEVITQEKLAEVMGISTKHLSAVERGKSRFSYEKLLFFCRFFDCSTDYIFFGRDKEITGEIPTEILSILSSDDQEEKKRLRDYLLMYVKLRSNR